MGSLLDTINSYNKQTGNCESTQININQINCMKDLVEYKNIFGESFNFFVKYMDIEIGKFIQMEMAIDEGCQLFWSEHKTLMSEIGNAIINEFDQINMRIDNNEYVEISEPGQTYYKLNVIEYKRIFGDAFRCLEKNMNIRYKNEITKTIDETCSLFFQEEDTFRADIGIAIFNELERRIGKYKTFNREIIKNEE